jgi:hypothetical protein
MPKKTVAQLMLEAEDALNRSLKLAKAAQSEDDGEPGSDLDGDHDELDQATAESDAAQEESEDGEGEAGDDTDETDSPDSDEEDGEEEDDGEDSPAGTMAKSVDGGGFMDAGELLTNIAGHLSDITAHMEHQNAEISHLRRENRTLAKAVQAQSQGTLLMVKAQQVVGSMPILPPSRQANRAARVTVPTSVNTPPASAGAQDNAVRATKIMAKAQQLASESRIPSQAVAFYHELFRSMPVDAALNTMTSDEQALFSGI